MTEDENRRSAQRPKPTSEQMAIWLASAIVALSLTACDAFRVDVGTSEPIALDPIKFEPIDINMNVEIYQYTGSSKSDSKPDMTKQIAVENQRTRSKQLIELLNSRWVGENHLGLLSIRHLPAGQPGEWVQEILSGENADREFLMKLKAKETGTTIEEVRRQQWENRKQKAWKWMLVEIEGDKPGEYRWAQRLKKDGPLVDYIPFDPSLSDDPATEEKEDG